MARSGDGVLIVAAVALGGAAWYLWKKGVPVQAGASPWTSAPSADAIVLPNNTVVKPPDPSIFATPVLDLIRQIPFNTPATPGAPAGALPLDITLTWPSTITP